MITAGLICLIKTLISIPTFFALKMIFYQKNLKVEILIELIK